jgi:hypothetical protein
MCESEWCSIIVVLRHLLGVFQLRIVTVTIISGLKITIMNRTEKNNPFLYLILNKYFCNILPVYTCIFIQRKIHSHNISLGKEIHQSIVEGDVKHHQANKKCLIFPCSRGCVPAIGKLRVSPLLSYQMAKRKRPSCHEWFLQGDNYMLTQKNKSNLSYLHSKKNSFT